MMLLTLCGILVIIAIFSILQHLRTRNRNQLGASRKSSRRR